jgi:hypothetical protein
MTDRPTKIIINCSTGEREIIELTDAEIAERELMSQQAELDRLEQEAKAQRIADLKASAKQKLVSGEPLTPEEADTLVL